MTNNAVVSSFLPAQEFHLTLIDERSLPHRLASEISLAFTEIKRALAEFRRAPIHFITKSVKTLRREIFQRDRWVGVGVAIMALVLIGFSVRLFEERVYSYQKNRDPIEPDSLSVQILSLKDRRDSFGAGRNGNGRVGVNRDRGEGSHTIRQNSGGGGSGGNHDRTPTQVGELPAPSLVQAAIPKAPPFNPPTLPAAGVDLDPALWRDLQLPQYGDPRSKSEAPSNGPGEEGGMGTRRGTGVGDGAGPGFGSGNNGNTGGEENQRGCCGSGRSSGGSLDGWDRRAFRVSEVEQRARLLAKPEPQYTEEARRNQTTGTVVLRVVFSSNGEVTQIRAVQPLPFGLTERAIAAARMIKFLPATKGGHPVSVQMQLEYNFNLY